MPAEIEGSVEHDVPDAERREGARDEGPADARDAAEVREREEGQADEDTERVGRQLPAAVADQATADASEE